jgi:hypothetical protein
MSSGGDKDGLLAEVYEEGKKLVTGYDKCLNVRCNSVER